MIPTLLTFILLGVVPAAAPVARAPQRVITDDSPVEDRSVDPAWPDGTGRVKRDTPDRARRIELVLGIAFLVVVLIYGLLRYQAKDARRQT